MSNSVSLWVDRVSNDETSFKNIIFHTSICVKFDDKDEFIYSYNENGLSVVPADLKNPPEKNILLGETLFDMVEVMEHAEFLANTKFKKYRLMSGNCNHFSNELSLKLCKKKIPSEYLNQAVTAPIAGGVVFGGIATVIGGVALIAASILKSSK